MSPGKLGRTWCWRGWPVSEAKSARSGSRAFRRSLPLRHVRALFDLAKAVGQRCERATDRAGKLPQAILSKAFSGELVPTEADLARADGRTYETAAELLARVTAEAPKPSATNRGRRMA